MSKVVSDGNNRKPQGGPWTFDSQSQNSSYGLSLLNSISMLSLQQEANLAQTLTGLSAAQRFQIYNDQGQLLFSAVENDRETLHRVCCAAGRGYILHICDQANQEVIRISHQFKCCGGCCCWCAGTEYCKYEVTIESPPGVVVGFVRQTRSLWRTHVSLKDAVGKEHLRIVGPCCICQGMFCCCWTNKFKLTTADSDVEIGGVYKEYAGFGNQAMTGAEKYTIRFPLEMPSQLKAIALGALFLINFKHFGGNARSKGGCSLLDILC